MLRVFMYHDTPYRVQNICSENEQEMQVKQASSTVIINETTQYVLGYFQ